MIKKILFILLLGLSFVSVKAYTYTEWSTEYPEGVKEMLIEEEVRYRWYKEVETDIEYLNKDSFGDKKYDLSDCILSSISDESMIRPNPKDYRVIYSRMRNHTFSAYEVDHIVIKDMLNNVGFYISEIEVLDKNNGNKIRYSFELNENVFNYLNDEDMNNYIEIEPSKKIVINLDKYYFVDDLEVNIYYKTNESDNNFSFRFYYGTNYSLYNKTIIVEKCDNNCMINVYRDNSFVETLSQRVYFYTYQDTLYKTYNIKREYVEGYYKELDGYIKDENSETTFYRHIENCYIYLDSQGELVPGDNLGYCDKNFCYFIFVKKKRMSLL